MTPVFSVLEKVDVSERRRVQDGWQGGRPAEGQAHALRLLRAGLQGGAQEKGFSDPRSCRGDQVKISKKDF